MDASGRPANALLKVFIWKRNSNIYTGKDLILKSQIIGDFLTGKMSIRMHEVMKSMRRDPIAEAAFKDTLIMTLRESWLMRNVDNMEKRRFYASQHMRLCARLLLELRSANAMRGGDNEDAVQDKAVWHYLHPKYYDQVAAAAISVPLP